MECQRGRHLPIRHQRRQTSHGAEVSRQHGLHWKHEWKHRQCSPTPGVSSSYCSTTYRTKTNSHNLDLTTVLRQLFVTWLLLWLSSGLKLESESTVSRPDTCLQHCKFLPTSAIGLARNMLISLNDRTEKILDDNPDLKRQWTSLIPQGKMGQPVDLMGPVTFLLSDASQYVTGADLRVDGGYTVT